MTISQKLRIAQKNIDYAKNQRQVNINLPCKFDHFWGILNFWAPKRPLLDAHSARTRYDVIWNFQHIFSFSRLRFFYVEMATSEGRRGAGGLQILRCDRALGGFSHYKILKFGLEKSYGSLKMHKNDLRNGLMLFFSFYH